MTEDMIDMLLINDLTYNGIAFLKLTVDKDGNVIRERIDPQAIEIREGYLNIIEDTHGN